MLGFSLTEKQSFLTGFADMLKIRLASLSLAVLKTSLKIYVGSPKNRGLSALAPVSIEIIK